MVSENRRPRNPESFHKVYKFFEANAAVVELAVNDIARHDYEIGINLRYNLLHMVVTNFKAPLGLIKIYMALSYPVRVAALIGIDYLRVGKLQNDCVAVVGNLYQKVGRNFEVAPFARAFSASHPVF